MNTVNRFAAAVAVVVIMVVAVVAPASINSDSVASAHTHANECARRSSVQGPTGYFATTCKLRPGYRGAIIRPRVNCAQSYRVGNWRWHYGPLAFLTPNRTVLVRAYCPPGYIARSGGAPDIYNW